MKHVNEMQVTSNTLKALGELLSKSVYYNFYNSEDKMWNSWKFTGKVTNSSKMYNKKNVNEEMVHEPWLVHVNLQVQQVLPGCRQHLTMHGQYPLVLRKFHDFQYPLAFKAGVISKGKAEEHSQSMLFLYCMKRAATALKWSVSILLQVFPFMWPILLFILQKTQSTPS